VYLKFWNASGTVQLPDPPDVVVVWPFPFLPPLVAVDGVVVVGMGEVGDGIDT
jgi:hypothetical protein